MRHSENCRLQNDSCRSASAQNPELFLKVSTEHDLLAEPCRDCDCDGKQALQQVRRIGNRTGGVTKNHVLDTRNRNPQCPDSCSQCKIQHDCFSVRPAPPDQFAESYSLAPCAEPRPCKRDPLENKGLRLQRNETRRDLSLSLNNQIFSARLSGNPVTLPRRWLA